VRVQTHGARKQFWEIYFVLERRRLRFSDEDFREDIGNGLYCLLHQLIYTNNE